MTGLITYFTICHLQHFYLIVTVTISLYAQGSKLLSLWPICSKCTKTTNWLTFCTIFTHATVKEMPMESCPFCHKWAYIWNSKPVSCSRFFGHVEWLQQSETAVSHSSSVTVTFRFSSLSLHGVSLCSRERPDVTEHHAHWFSLFFSFSCTPLLGSLMRLREWHAGQVTVVTEAADQHGDTVQLLASVLQANILHSSQLSLLHWPLWRGVVVWPVCGGSS